MKIPLIQVKNLVREFPAGDTNIRILHGLDLTLYQGEMVAIIGQSGSGKSTLMNILGCLDKATSGSYTIFGKSVDDMDSEELARLRREHFGFIFQRYHLLGDINALAKSQHSQQTFQYHCTISHLQHILFVGNCF